MSPEQATRMFQHYRDTIKKHIAEKSDLCKRNAELEDAIIEARMMLGPMCIGEPTPAASIKPIYSFLLEAEKGGQG